MSLNFTKQQLEGGSKYGTKSLIGNWSEDLKEEEVKFAEYLYKKKKSQLVIAEKHAARYQCMQPCPVTVKAEGEPLCFGDSVMVQHVQLGAALSVTLQGGHDGSWDVSTCPSEEGAITRNTFRIHPISNERKRNIFTPLTEESRTPLHYGDSFCLISEKSLTADDEGVVLPPYWLSCMPKSFHKIAKHSTESPVTMQKQFSPASIWRIETSLLGSAGWRKNVSKSPVLVGDCFVLKSHMSNKMLTCSKAFSFYGKFSDLTEYEAYGRADNNPNDSNTWTFLVGSDSEQALDRRGFADVNADLVLTRIFEAFGDATEFGAFMSELRHIDKNNEITREEACHAIQEYIGLNNPGSVSALTIEIAVDYLSETDGIVSDQRVEDAIQASLGESKLET